MEVDHEYIKSLLLVFKNSEKQFVDLEDFVVNDIEYEDIKFPFHMDMLLDKNIIKCISRNGGIGYTFDGNGKYYWSSVPIRMTASGYEYLSAICQPQIWDKLIGGLKGASFDVMKSTAIELATLYAKKKAKDIFGEVVDD